MASRWTISALLAFGSLTACHGGSGSAGGRGSGTSGTGGESSSAGGGTSGATQGETTTTAGTSGVTTSGGSSGGVPDAGEDAGGIDGGAPDAGPEDGGDDGGYYGMGIGADALDNQQVADVDVDFRFLAAASGSVVSVIWYDISRTFSVRRTRASTPAPVRRIAQFPARCTPAGQAAISKLCIATDDGTPSHLATSTNLGCLEHLAPLDPRAAARDLPIASPSRSRPALPPPLAQPRPVAARELHLGGHAVGEAGDHAAAAHRLDLDLAVFRGTTLRLEDTPIFSSATRTAGSKGKGTWRSG